MPLNSANIALKPVFKWVGGKRQLLGQLNKYAPKYYETYFEPFIGGGAFLLDLQPSKAVINDINVELINVYQVIKDNPEALIANLKVHQKYNSKEYYLKLREVDRNGTIDDYNAIQRAARILYMLRVDFNGLYRVNRKGQFNVPYGKYKNPNIVNAKNIRDLNYYFNHKDIQIMNTDFECAVMNAKKNDFVYFDPPYIPLTSTASFTSYTNNGFNLDDQKRLAKLFFKLSQKGVSIMESNSDTLLTRQLYSNANIHVVKAKRAINSNVTKRGAVNELIITNY